MKEKEKKSELCEFVGTNLREIRAKMSLSQETVANEASLSVSHYRGIEQGCGNPSIQTLERISDTLNISLQEILMQGVRRAPDYFSLQDFSLSEEDAFFFKNLLQQIIDLLVYKK